MIFGALPMGCAVGADMTFTKQSLPPILRWAGSKRRLLPELIAQIPERFSRYIEPFSGSACLFFAIRPHTAILGDLNSELIDAYKTLRAHPFLTWRELTGMPNESDFYYKIRDVDPTQLLPIKKAARFIFLNRHCFNGVYRTNRAGKFNVPMGTRLGTMPDQRHFNRCAYALRNADLMDNDFESVVSRARAGDFIYLDPPYAKVNARQRGEYGYSSFNVPDLSRLDQSLQKIHTKKASFLLSYADCPEIDIIRGRWFSKTIQVRRHVAGFHTHRCTVSEVLISNRPIKKSPVPK
jgi:DNA adenine methylase